MALDIPAELPAEFAGARSPLTLEAIKKEPLRRGDVLKHYLLGPVSYKSKVKRKPETIVVTQTNTTTMETHEFKVKLSECFRDPVPSKKKPQSTRLILCYCPECDLRMRVAMTWLEKGEPTCFNKECPTWEDKHARGGPLVVEVGEDAMNPGKLNVDRSLRMKLANHAAHGTPVKLPHEETKTPKQTDEEWNPDKGDL